MAEKDVPHVLPGDDAREGIGLGQLDPVHPVDADVEGRVVHEDIDGPAGRLGQPRAQPALPRRTVLAGGDGLVPQRVEEQEHPLGRRVHALHKALPVVHHARQFGAQRRTVVMVADHKEGAKRKPGQPPGQPAIGARVTVIGQIARDDAERRIAMQPPDVVEHAPQPLARVEPPDRLARRRQMRVCHMDDLHRPSPLSLPWWRLTRRAWPLGRNLRRQEATAPAPAPQATSSIVQGTPNPSDARSPSATFAAG